MTKNEIYYYLWDKESPLKNSEFEWLRRYIKNQNFIVKYGFYNKTSERPICLIYDLIPKQMRRTGVENNWTILAERKMSNAEIIEFINFYFKISYKRFLVFYYSNINKLIIDDEKLNIKTPTSFIEECEKKGLRKNLQLKLI